MTCEHCGCDQPLNDIMEPDHVITVDEGGHITEPSGVYAPELDMGTEDGQILDRHEQDYIDQARRQGWELLTGFTGQHAYRGPVMHPSEFVGGGLEDHIRETPGTYAVIVVRCDDGEDAGWAVAYRPPPEQCTCTVPPGGPLDSMIARKDCPEHGPDLRAAAEAGPYTHIVRRASGYVAGYFRGEPPAEFVAECNANVPDDPAHTEVLDDEWPNSFTDDLPVDLSRKAIDSRPQTGGNPYTAYTPESRVWEIAQAHGKQAAAKAIAGVKPDQAGYRELLTQIPEWRSRPGSSVSEPHLRRDDLPGYALADLMSQADWVPHDGTDLRDELASQYESQARIAFWNEIERLAREHTTEGE